MVTYKNNLIKKIRSILKFVMSQTGKQAIPIHILANTSRSIGNQIMKSGQLIEYNTKNVFFFKFEHISGSISKVLYNLFLLHAKLRGCNKKYFSTFLKGFH